MNSHASILLWSAVYFGAGMHVVAAGSVTYHCLLFRREATSAILWILLSWFVPALGATLYLAVGVDRVPAKGWQRHRRDREFLAHRRAREAVDLPLVYWRAVHRAAGGEPGDLEARELNRVMDAILPEYPLLGGNRLCAMVTGDEAYPAMIEAIQRAQHHVHLQTFMIRNDRVGRMFLDVLAEKAREGVAVRLLYDRFGSTHAVLTGLFRRYRGRVPNLQLAGWTQAKLLKRQFQINLRNHRKVLVVDGTVGFLGGMNLHEENLAGLTGPAIRDYHFAVNGPIVQELQYSFLCDWFFMTDEDPDQLLRQEHFPPLEPAGASFVRLINGSPATTMEELADVVFACIAAARRQILVVTPYFVPRAELVRALRVAALRGADVRLVVPRENNHAYAGYAGRALYEELLEAGVRVLERRPPFLHAKALVVDDRVAIVGSANLDVRSLYSNYETDVAVYDDAFVGEMKSMILEEIAESDELDLVTWRNRPARARLLENFCSLLTPVL